MLPESSFAQQLQEMHQQVNAPLEGTNWALVQHETAQYKEYLSKLKFTLTELNTKEAFLTALLREASDENEEGTTTRGTKAFEQENSQEHQIKAHLKTVKQQIESQEQTLRCTYESVQDKLAEQKQKISLLAQLSAQCTVLVEKNQSFLQKTYPARTLEETLHLKTEQSSELLKLQCTTEQLEESISELRESIAATRSLNTLLEHEEAETAKRASEAVNARMNGNREVEKVHSWLQAMQKYMLQFGVGAAAVEVEWERCNSEGSISMLFGGGAVQVKAEVSPVDFTLKKFECLSLREEEGAGFGKRIPVEPGDSLALLVRELQMRVGK